MEAWLSYRPADLLMFSPETYFRLFVRYNAALWPAQLPAAALGLGFLVAMRAESPRWWRFALILLAGAWLLIARGFFLRHYAEIFPVASYFAAAFALQALLLLMAAGLGGVCTTARSRVTAWIGRALLLYGIVLHPMLSALAARTWQGMELFLLAPDPTAVGTLGLLLYGGRAWPLAILPLLWLGVSGLTYWVMGADVALAAPAAGLVGASAALVGQLLQRHSGSGR